MPKKRKKVGNSNQREKQHEILKILLKTNSVNINLQTLTAKNRPDFLGSENCYI